MKSFRLAARRALLTLLVSGLALAMVLPAMASAGSLAERATKAEERDQRAIAHVDGISTRLDGVNTRLISVGAQLESDRAALLEQANAVSTLEQTVELSSAALAAAQTQLTGADGSRIAPGGGDSSYLLNLEAIPDLRVRRVIGDAIATGGDVETTLVDWQTGASDQVDAQLDLYRAVMWDVGTAQAKRIRLIRLQRDLLSKLSDARADQVATSMAWADLEFRLGGTPNTGNLPAGPPPSTGTLGDPFAVCPVDPPRVVSDDFGDPRYGGGFHLHAGNDILAPRGTAIRAPFNGVAEDATNTLGGTAVRVTGVQGYVYNAHLDAFGTLGRVRAGDVIGYVGNSGDAAGGPTHDHFEWHPNDIGGEPTINGAIDPHPFLAGVCPA